MKISIHKAIPALLLSALLLSAAPLSAAPIRVTITKKDENLITGWVTKGDDKSLYVTTNPKAPGSPLPWSQIANVVWEDPADWKEGLKLWTRRDYAAGAKVFGDLAKAYEGVNQLQDSIGAKAKYYQGECLRRSGRYAELMDVYDEVKRVNLSEAYQRQILLFNYWGHVGKKLWPQLSSVINKRFVVPESEVPDYTIPPTVMPLKGIEAGLQIQIALSQSLFRRAPEAKAIAAREKRLRERLPTGEEAADDTTEQDAPEKIAMLEQCRTLLHRFLTLYPEDPLTDDAAFSEANVFFALKDYANVVKHASRSAERHPDSKLKSSFEYMAALGHFWQRHYDEALASATSVANGDSKDRDYARYITAQIYHATGKPAEAMDWYEKVRTLYPDAADAIDYFQEKKISMGEVTTLKPGEPVEIELDYRNIKEAALEIYKVDLMKLYLREKNLSNITAVDLAGIDPEGSLNIPLGDGKDFADKNKKATLPIKEEGAYLVICRGDNLYTSGLILITPLKLEIQETPDEGEVRVNVRDLTDGGNFIPEVLVKVVGTNNDKFFSGLTDLRGVYQADGVNGQATVLAKSDGGKYAFYRGTNIHGMAQATTTPAEDQSNKPAKSKKQLEKSDYLGNILEANEEVQKSNVDNWDAKRRGDNKGVEVKKAY